VLDYGRYYIDVYYSAVQYHDTVFFFTVFFFKFTAEELSVDLFITVHSVCILSLLVPHVVLFFCRNFTLFTPFLSVV